MDKIIKNFMDYATWISGKSTCLRRKVGAVIVKEDVILSCGYNGAPAPTTLCCETGCLRQKNNVPSGQRHELCRGVHAEQSAINQAAKYGISLDQAILYCTTYPCSMCAKSIINSGIKKVYYQESYPDPLAKALFAETDIELICVNSL